MPTSLRVLILEDNPFDAELVLRELVRGGYVPDSQRVDNEADFLSALSSDYDIILSDYDMPMFNASRALELLRDAGHDIPFIIISGTIGEDVAVQVMKLGATDYLLKDRLAKLSISVAQAIDQVQLRRERTRAIEALRQSEQSLRILTEELEVEKARLSAAQAVAKMGSWDMDIIAMACIWSAETYHIFEVSPETFKPNHQRFLLLVHPDDRVAVEDVFTRSLKERHISSTEHRVLMPDGRIKFIEQHWQVFHDGHGRPLRALGTCRDITERKHAEAALRESEERFRQLADNIQEVFWITDATSHRVLYISPGYHGMWGRTCESLYDSAETWFQAIHPEDRQRVRDAAAHKQLEGAYDEEYRILRPDGTQRWIRDRAFPVRNARGEVYRIVGVARDVTERIHAHDQLREQASLLDKARDAILVRDLEDRITYWNKGAEQIYGWTAEEVRGRKVSELVYRDPAPFEKANAAAMQLGEWLGELQQVTKSGADILVEARWTLVRDDAGQPQSILAINTDITEKKKMEQQFLRTQRLENIGTLAGGIAHDLNNVLAPILMSIGLLRLTSADPRSKAVLTTIETSAKRGADMVRQILSFARGVEGQRAPLDVRTVIHDIQHLFHETFPKNIQLLCDVSQDLPTVLADQTQLHQVLLNLCVNARDVMPSGGTLSITAVGTTVDDLTASTHPHATAGPHLLIKVTDTGTGMPPEVVDKIFDPFFTTKEVGKGTGLGLSTVMTIVKSHGGFLDVHSRPGHGTTFSIYLPTSDASSEISTELPASTLPCGQGELILVVDDEVAVRSVTQQTLEAFGYHVLLAADGTEALSLYAAHQAQVAAVVTDLMMPVMDGSMTIQVLQRISPAVKIIAGSGVATDGTSAHMASLGVTKFLPKPYSAHSLLTALRELLDSPA